MRRKIYIGAFLAAVVGIVAGGSLLNRSDAQDPTKKSDEKKASDLFELLKKDLDGKKDPVPPPALVIPPPSDPGLKVPTLTPPESGKADVPKKADPLPPLVVPPPVGDDKAKPADLVFPKAEKKNDPLGIPPPVIVDQATPIDPKPAATSEPKKLDATPLPVPMPEPKEGSVTFPPVSDKPMIHVPPLGIGTQTTPKKDEPKNDVKPTDKPITFPPLEPKKDNPTTFPPLQDKKAQADIGGFPPLDNDIKPKTPQPIVDELAKIKNCPWSLQVDVVDGQTIVIATVNKKHEFKIVCQSLDLQTGKGTLKAVGKVQITGDMMTASCDQLAIPLMEDRLMLEGNAAISIQKASTNVSNTKPAAFELKGTTLDLRISDLPGARILQTSMQKAVPLEARQAATPPSDAKKWTGFGKLVRSHHKAGPELRLEKSNGDVIAYIMTNEGKSLEGYVGRTISVLGATEETVGTTPVLRVTHIALP